MDLDWLKDFLALAEQEFLARGGRAERDAAGLQPAHPRP